ncbi:phosphonate ABC transporter, permease protein PhnE [Reyranella sp. CPCC 100927]|uniref:phosphonate ABC transporter, permease protein PhnE n=1 Tax=Reyranella sp. CPCC 100927 TaxID=2599616 RepID=UPI0011B8310A|nr:phosphonate ABC transporter, permease protein PhnE [Reyranella sp. CPCC 100927]TWS98337.1 phosphonate ABC transporter, permease protein PhnE [Reyranella sp. CPCC 100927]
MLERGYREAVRIRRTRALLIGACVFIGILLSGISAEVDLGKLTANIGKFTSYIGRIFLLENGQPVWTDPVEWYWGLGHWLSLLGETLLIAYVGTALGAAGGFVLAFLAASNLSPHPVVRAVTRRYLEFCRTFPNLVFALIFVIAFGLGPLPGVLAIAIHTMGALGKLFFEVIENIDMKPVEGVAASGAAWPTVVRFGAVPQVLSNFVSYTLLRFEINVREASVMGFVGAGGIGQDLIESIRKFYYADVSAILVLIIITVAVIDFITERIRHRLIDAGTSS